MPAPVRSRRSLIIAAVISAIEFLLMHSSVDLGVVTK
jgi:hypothetical protein